MPLNEPKRVMPFHSKLQVACRALAAGGVIAYPTEAVWGLGCDPRNDDAVRKLLALKRRDWRKGLILIAADFSQLQRYVMPVSQALLSSALETWPGPHTWLFPASAAAPPLVTGGRSSIAVRVTAHPLAAALCARYGGALVSTSANVAGRLPAHTATQVRQRFNGQLDYLLAGALGGHGTPTSIRDLATGKVVRA